MRRARAKRLLKLDGELYSAGTLLPTDLDEHTYEVLRKRNQIEWVEAPPPRAAEADEDDDASDYDDDTTDVELEDPDESENEESPAEPEAPSSATEDEQQDEAEPATEDTAEEPESEDEAEAEFPVHEGGGWYRLSNGDKIRGEESAIAAEEAL